MRTPLLDIRERQKLVSELARMRADIERLYMLLSNMTPEEDEVPAAGGGGSDPTWQPYTGE